MIMIKLVIIAFVAALGQGQPLANYRQIPAQYDKVDELILDRNMGQVPLPHDRPYFNKTYRDTSKRLWDEFYPQMAHQKDFHDYRVPQSRHTVPVDRTNFILELWNANKTAPLSQRNLILLQLDRLSKLYFDQQRLSETYLSLLLTGLCFLGLIASEVYHMYQLGKFKFLEEETIKLTDISHVWPENEGQYVLVQGFLRLQGMRVRDQDLGIEVEAPFLIREAKMLQWVEEKVLDSQQALIQRKLLLDIPIAKMHSHPNRNNIRYQYKQAWANKLIDSSKFHRERLDREANPPSFGIEQKMTLVSDNMRVGAFNFDEDFVLDSLYDELYLEVVRDLDKRFSGHGDEFRRQNLLGMAPEWVISKERDQMERRMNPEEESIGDLRVRYLTDPRLSGLEKQKVTVFGRQRGHSIDNKSEDSIYRAKTGDFVGFQELFSEDISEIVRSRLRNRLILLGCMCLFIYGVIANEFVSLGLWIPSADFSFQVGQFSMTLAVTSVLLLLAILISKPVYFLY